MKAWMTSRQTSTESCGELQIAICTLMSHVLDTILLCVDCWQKPALRPHEGGGATMGAEVYRLVLC